MILYPEQMPQIINLYSTLNKTFATSFIFLSLDYMKILNVDFILM